MTSAETCGPVGRRLAELGERLHAEGAAQVGGAFTDSAEADRFVKESPDAFLIGVLFTQGIPAERAWAAPYLLRQRLGHFDLERLARERDAVAAAVAMKPALHRFKMTVADWVSDSAGQIVERWGGRAEDLWADAPTARVLRERLMSFPGIGRKKAAMAVELIGRVFGVEIGEASGGTVAYDTQVRRVFLRSGLVDRDTVADVERAAAKACPEAPGRLDLPAWLIGRQWCHPSAPACGQCWLADVCPRLVDRGVAGVGTRKPKVS